jgi:hypothetical protein
MHQLNIAIVILSLFIGTSWCQSLDEQQQNNLLEYEHDL